MENAIHIYKEASRPNALVNLRAFFPLLICLALCGLFISIFNIEAEVQLPVLMPLVIGGFALHTWLPFKYRKAFLFSLNIIALILLFGLKPALIVLATGIAIIGISRMRAPYRIRLALILGITLILALIQLDIIPVGADKISIRVLGALFMFRLMLYLYETRIKEDHPDFVTSLCYFFLLPNLVFFIFPVVDLKTFRRNYYNRPAAEIYRKGLRWILLGLAHLFIYRLIYTYLIPAPGDISGIFSLLQFMIASYLLIIRLSGFFHLSVGIICLFGFDLPVVFTNFFTASDFNVYWRRINIYWRDFVQKVFFFPVYFRFKNRNARALILSTLIIFFINWLLHSFQWFWIRGNFPIRWTDFIFWTAFGILLAWSQWRQQNKKSPSGAPGFRESLKKAAGILAVFMTTVFLWSIWISDSLANWWRLLNQAGLPSPGECSLLLVILIATLLIGSGLLLLEQKYKQARIKTYGLSNRSLFSCSAILGILVILGSKPVTEKIAPAIPFSLDPILETQLNKADQERLFQGYYESLVVNTNIGSAVPDMERQRPDNWDKLNTTGIIIETGDLLEKRLVPDTSVVFKEALLETNSFGLRDRAYTLQKAAGTFRIALLGTSIEMGSGVSNLETFENQLEDKLNRDPLFDYPEKIEILNFAISGTHMPQQVARVEQKIPPFDPDMVIYTAHPNEEGRAIRKFTLFYKDGWSGEYTFLDSIGRAANIQLDDSHESIQRKLRPYGQQLIRWGLTQIAEKCQEADIIPLWIFIPSFGESPHNNENKKWAEFAESIGFLSYDLSDLYEGYPKEEVCVRPWDRHPSVLGHKLIAESIYKKWKEDLELQERINQ